MSRPSEFTIRFLPAVTIVSTWAFLSVVALRTTRSVYSPLDALAIVTLYLSLSIALVSGARAIGRLGPIPRLGATFVVGLVLAWHWREQTRIEGTGPTLWTFDGLLAFAPLAIALGAGLAAVEALIRRRVRADAAQRRDVATCAVASAVFLVLLAGVFFSAGTGRWHLIRHNQMIGSAAFHLFATPVAEIEEIEWSAHRHGAPVGQPSWVLDLHSQGEAFAERTATAAGAPGQEIRRPDIVFVMLDTLRADSLAAYGGDPTAMPALNQRAASSTVFTDVLANAPWTQPSVASFFTGLLPEEHGVISIHHRMSTGVATLAEVLQSLGYQTAAFVANPVIVNPDAGFVRGFDHFEFVPGAAGAYARADLLTDRAAAWLAASSAPEEAGAESSETGTTSGPAPLFLYIHYMDPHVPYLSSGITAREDATLSFERARGYYVDELRFLDVELERLFTLLDAALPRSRATLITADHGEEFGEHDGLGHSQTLHSEVLRIPALFQWARRRELPRASRPTPETGAAAEPGPAPDGDVIDVRLEGRDFFDLLLRTASGRVADLETWSASADRPARIASLYFEKDPGRSALVHYLLRPYRAHIYSRMIQRDDLRYIRSAFGPTDELYDLAADPGERVNAAATKAAQVAYLRAELDGSPADWVRRVPLQLSDEALEDLRTLGYIR